MILDKVEAFFAGPTTMVAASRDADLQPYSTRAYGVLLDGDAVEFYIAQQYSEPMVDNYRDNGRVALVADNLFTLEAYQLKGGLAEIRPCGEAEHARMDAYVAATKAALLQFEYPEEAVENFNAWKCQPGWAVRFAVETVFHQTPRPGTGDALEV